MPRILDSRQFTDGSTALPVASGAAYISDPGTTNEKTVYSDEAETTAVSQPISLDSEGRITTDIYTTGKFRLQIYDSTDTGTRDGVLVLDDDDLRGAGELGATALTSPLLLDDSTSTAAPVLTFDGDTDTGISRPAADTLAGVHGGSEGWRSNTTGVGIGKTPTVPLDVDGVIQQSGGIRTGSFSYISGVTTVLTLSINSSLYLIWSDPNNYGSTDDRHGELALAGRYSDGRCFVTRLAAAPTGTAAFAISGNNVTYNESTGGTPATNVRWLRLS